MIEGKLQPLHGGKSPSPASGYYVRKGTLKVELNKGHSSPPHMGSPTKLSPQNEQETPEGGRQIDVDASPLSSSKPPRVKRPQSVEEFVKSNSCSPSPQSSGMHYNNKSLSESPDFRTAKLAWEGQSRMTEPSRNETEISNGYTDSVLQDFVESCTLTASQNVSSMYSFREYDDETLSVLNICFPPSTTPTFGLSRSVSPLESERERYNSLVEKAIHTSMVAPLSREWKKKTHDFLPKSLKQDFKETLDELDKVFVLILAFC